MAVSGFNRSAKKLRVAKVPFRPTVIPVFSRLLPFCVFALLLSFADAKPQYPSMGPDIFDVKAPAEDLIADALVTAKREDKQVLLLFGANWCPWCRRLHRALSTDERIRARLESSFVLVHVDANTRQDKNRNAAVLKKYGDPIAKYGLPVFVILAADGRQLTTRETASLAAESGTEEADRILKFLDQWRGKKEPNQSP